MRLKNLKLRNIRSYVSEDIAFPDGAIMLAGDIGSGKSSILMALEFALFGMIKGNIDGSALLRNGANSGEVELYFNVGKKEYVIKRTLKRQKDAILQTQGYMIEDGMKTEGTATELKAKILDVLGYPKELLTKSKSLIYRYTIYTPQEDMKKILFEDKEMRLDTLRKVFGVEKYSRIKENAEIISKEIKARIRDSEVRCMDFEEKLLKMQDEKKKIIDLVTKEKVVAEMLDSAIKFTKEKDMHFTDSEKNVEELKQVGNKIGMLNQELEQKAEMKKRNDLKNESLKKEFVMIKEEIEKLGMIDGKKEEINDKIRSQEKKIIEISQEKARIEENIKLCKTGIVEMQRILKEVENIHDDFKNKQDKIERCMKFLDVNKDAEKRDELLSEERHNIEEEMIKLSSAVDNSKKIIDKIVKLDNCPLCFQEVKDEHKSSIKQKENMNIADSEKILDELKKSKESIVLRINENKELMKRLSQIKEEKTRTEVEIEGMKRRMKDIEENRKKMDLLAQDEKKYVGMLEKLIFEDIEEMKKNNEMLKRRLDAMTRAESLKEKADERINSIKDIEEDQMMIKKRIGEINLDKMNLAEKYKEYEAVLKRHNEIKAELDLMRGKENNIRIKLAEINKEKEGVDRIVELLEKEIDDKKTEKEKILSNKELVDWMNNFFVNLVSNVENHVMAKIHQEFDSLFQKWFGMLVESEIMNARLNNDFTPVIEQNGYEVEVENLSGGEKTAVALAYRLSLNRVINDVISDIKTKDLIILDEPTDGFSEQQLDKVREVLDELRVKQLVLVSHESKIESFAEHIIRIGKSQHVSRVIA